MGRFSLSLVLAVLALLLVAGSAASSDAVTANVPLTMSDGVRLSSDEYVPDHGCPCPVVVNFNPYTNATARNGGVGTQTMSPSVRSYLVAHGFVVLVVDVRGTGQSEGEFGMFNSREQRDYAEVIRQAAALPFSNGRVAVVGLSYGGIAALLAAEQPGIGASDGGPLRAVVSAVTMGDAYRDIGFSGGAPNDEFLTVWGAGLVGAPSTAAPLLSAQDDPQMALNAASTRGENWAGLVQAFLGANGADTSSEGDPESLAGASSHDGPWFRLRSPLTHIDRIRVPTFIVGTSQDIFPRAEPMVFNALSLPSDEKRLYIDNRYHAYVGWDASSEDGSTEVYDDHGKVVPNPNTSMTVAWLDHWMGGPATDLAAWPQVLRRYQTPGGSSTGVFVRQRRDPPRGLRYQRLYLARGGALSRRPANAAGTAQTVFNPLSGACSHNSTQYLYGIAPDNRCSQDSTVNEADGITFTGPPLTDPTAITGPASLRLVFSVNRPDTNLAAFLSAVAPDGSASQVTFGTVIASLRAVNRKRCKPPAVVMDCSTYADGSIVAPWHPYTPASESKLVPGRVYEALVEIYPPSIALSPGYRLRLTLKSGTFPQAVPTVTTNRDAVGGTTTFYFGGGHAAYLNLGSVSGGLATLRDEYDGRAREDSNL